MSYFEQFMKANQAYVDLHGTAHLPIHPKTRVAIVTCMDSRLHVAQALGLALGDAHILRNAGGRVTDDMIRSLVISQQQLGTREIIVIHHTDCGAQTLKMLPLHNSLSVIWALMCMTRTFFPLQTWTRACVRTWRSCDNLRSFQMMSRFLERSMTLTQDV